MVQRLRGSVAVADTFSVPSATRVRKLHGEHGTVVLNEGVVGQNSDAQTPDERKRHLPRLQQSMSLQTNRYTLFSRLLGEQPCETKTYHE